MATFETLDELPDLTASQIENAVLITLIPTTLEQAVPEWDNSALVIRSIPYVVENPVYQLDAKEGATYDISAISFAEPSIIIYDRQGNAILVNDDSDDFEKTGIDSSGPHKVDDITDWVAPYTGVYYIDAGWQQENTASTLDFIDTLNIHEDIDTATSGNTNSGGTQSSAQSHLATYGVTVQQANDFILSNADQPATIFNTAKQFGVTTLMLSEISGISTDVISNFFASFGMNTDELNGIIPVNIPSSHKLLPDNLASLSNLIVFNTNSGILSTDSLREQIFLDAYEPDYIEAFNPNNYQGASDGVFTAEELGVAHLDNLPATTGTLESLVYGTLINALRAIDESEIIQIITYLNTHPNPTDNTVTSEFVTLMNDVFSDPSSDPVFRDDVQLAKAMYNVGDGFVEDVIRNDFNDILITSLIGVTTVSMLELIATDRTDVFVDSGGVFL